MKRRNLPGLFIVLCAVCTMAETLPDYIAVEAWRHIGEKANVTGRVERVYQSQDGSIFLDLGGKHPDNPFTAFIPQSAAEKFPNFKELDGITITVSGRIKEYHKKAEIVVTEPSQIARK
jgi:DNA/RNA endonuclease YhcR with UshA esterase domain